MIKPQDACVMAHGKLKDLRSAVHVRKQANGPDEETNNRLFERGTLKEHETRDPDIQRLRWSRHSRDTTLSYMGPDLKSKFD